MKILFIGGGHRFWGMEQALLTLEAGLVTRGVSCAHVVNGWGDGEFARRLIKHGVHASPIKLGQFYLRQPLWTLHMISELPDAVAALRRVARTFRPNLIVHLNNRLFPIAYVALLGTQCKHIYLESVIPGHSQFDRWTYKLIFSACPLVITNTKAALKRFHELGFTGDRLSVVHNGITFQNLSCVMPKIRRPIRIGIVGQVMPRKGHDVLLLAFRYLIQKGHEARLVIVGDEQTEFAAVLKARCAEWELEPFVTWSGYLSEKCAIYDQFDILVVPSRSEAHALVAIEGGAAGLPVVASRTGGLVETIVDGQTGFLADPESANSLAELIEQLIQDSALRVDMGAAARRHIRSVFGAERMVESFLDVIGQVM